MRYGQLMALFLSLALLPPYPTAAQVPDATPDLGVNAALKYWQAFAVLPALDKDQEKLLLRWNKVPLDEAALALIERSRSSRLYLHRGAKLTRCDWSLDVEDGVGLLLSHCPRSLTLARLAALHARHAFEQGDPKAGWEDVTDLLKLGRHVGMGPQFVVRWVDYKIETMAIEAAAPYLPELKPILPKVAPAVLDELPVGPTLAQMVLSEKQIGLRWLVENMEETERLREGSWKEMWKNFFEGTGDQNPETFEQAVRILKELLPLYDQLAKIAALPQKEFDAQYPEFVKKAKAGKPLTSFVLPPMDKIVARERRYQAQVALFKAALAVVQGGPDRLKDIKDPFGDRPFEYRARGKGFELKSKLLDQGRPITLTVGHRFEE